jgi:hypothetical protein
LKEEKYYKLLFYVLKGVLWFDGEKFRVDKTAKKSRYRGTLFKYSFVCPDEWCQQQIDLLKELKKIRDKEWFIENGNLLN